MTFFKRKYHLVYSFYRKITGAKVSQTKSIFFAQKRSIGCRYIAKRVTDMHQRFPEIKGAILTFRQP